MNWKVVLAVLSVNVFFMCASYTMLVPFLPMYLTSELGVSAEAVNIWSGAAFSAAFVVSAFVAPLWGKLADKHGRRLMAMRSSAMLAISYGLCGLVQTPEQLIAVRLFHGFASGLWPMDLAIMTLYAPQAKVGYCLGILQSINICGGIMGPLLGGVLATLVGMRESFFLGAAGLTLNFLVVTFLIKEPPDPERERKAAAMARGEDPDAGRPKFSPWRMPILRDMLLSGMLVSMVILILQPVLPTYITSLVGQVDNLPLVCGIVFSLGGLAGAIAAPFWGTLGQRRGFMRTLCWGAIGAGLCLIVQSLPHNLYLFAALQFAGGLFFAGIFPALNSNLAANTPSDYKGRIFGLLFSVQQAGSFLGPLLGGIIATYLGMHYIFIIAGGLLLLLSLTLYRKYLHH